MIPLELTLSKIHNNFQRASHPPKAGRCANARFSPKEKIEAHNTNAKWTRFCETILWEGGLAKPRLMFLKFGGVWIFAPQEGVGGMRGGFFFLAFLCRG